MSLTMPPSAARAADRLPSALKTVQRAEGTRIVVVLRGEADLSSPMLYETLPRVVALKDQDVVIDLADADLVDTGTVRAFALCQQLLNRQDRSSPFGRLRGSPRWCWACSG
jgi:anti-anti-sigma regulatory factor